MSKYTPEQLSAMAAATLKSLQYGEQRGKDVVLWVSAITGLTPFDVVERIKLLK